MYSVTVPARLCFRKVLFVILHKMNTKLSNKHRFFVQFMLSNGTVTLNHALTFFEKISPEGNSMTHLKTLIIEINREIGNQSFKIASSVCEVTGEKVFVWLNSKNDEISKLQVGFSDSEKEYFHAVMREIVTSDEHRILYPRSINISSTLNTTLSRENGEKALTRWIRGGYFVKKEQFVYLGPRLILEFTTYLRTNTDNCTCELCSELVFSGVTCNSCSKNFHSFCIEKYFQNQHTCPSCKEEWESANSSMDVDEAGPSQR